MNMIKKNEYYQLCYSNEKVDKGCEKLLEGQMSLNSTSILEYIFEWEYIVRRRAFSDRQLQNSYKITSICKICKDINIGLKKDIPSKTFSASCCDITKESLLSYKNCQSLEVCSNCKFSQLIMLKSNNIQFTCLNNSFCLRKKYHSTHFSRSLINSYNFSNTNIFLGCSSSHHYEILGKDRFCDMLNNQSTTFNSQSSQSVNCERFNQSYLKSIKKNEEKYKANYETQYSVLPSLSPSSLHKSKSSPQLQREKSVHCSNKVIGLEQPSSFVKTVYQYIDEDVFMLKYASTDSIQVYSSGLMRHFQELKPKLKCRYTKVPLKRTIECGANENITFFSGRRISETSASIISTLAFISQESIKSSLNYKKDILTSTHLYKLRIKNGDRHCIFNRLSDWFEILERNLKPAKNGLKPFISDQDLNLNDRNQAFCNKKVKFKKLKHAAFFLSRKSQEKIFFYNKSVKRNIYSNSSLSFQKSNNFKLQKCCVDKSSLPKDNSKISTLFLKHRLSLPQPISKYGELFKNKQTKINKCDEKMSTGSIDYLDKMKSDYNENLDVFNNNINSLSQSLKCDVDSFTAKDLLSLSKQKKNSDEKNFQLDKKKIEKHDLIDLGLLHCNSMNEKLKTDSVKELSKDDLEIKRSRKGSFIGKIKRKYMGSRSCDIEYFKSGLDKNAGHSEESGSKFGIRYHSEVIIEEESKTSPKVSGNRKWKKDSKEKTNKTTELPKESKFSTILSVFEQDNLSTDSKITKNVKSTTNIKLKSSEKKSVIESKKKVLSNSPKKSSVPSFLTTFSPLRARKNSNNIPVQKSAEELDNKISAKEKELKELKIQQNQNRTEIDEVKPRSVSANGYYKPHKHVMFAEDSENVNFASQSSSTFLTTEHHLKKCVSSPSILSKSNFLFEPQQTFNCIDNKQIYSSPLKDSIELLDNNLIKQESQDFLCKSSTNNKNLSHKCIATNANISRVMCQESKLSNESFQNFLKVQDICFSVNSRNIFGEVAKKYEGSPITKERIKHLEQSLTPLLKQHSVVEENKFQSLSSSKIAMIIPFMKDTSKTGDEGFSSKNQYLLKRSNTRQPQKSYFDQPSSVKSILQSNGYLPNVDTKNKSQIFLDKDLKSVKGANRKTKIDKILFQPSEFLNPEDSSFKNSQKANKCNDTLLLKNSSSDKLYKTTLNDKFQDLTFDQCKLIVQKKSNRKIVDSISVANYSNDNKVLNSQPDINNNSTSTGSNLEINEMTKQRSNSCPVKFNSQIIGINEENQSASCIVDSNIDPFDKFEMDNSLALKKEENVGENLKVQTKTQRSNSTGHSPDIKLMLQHLICDIEEEDYISSEEDPSKKSESTSVKSYENFNRNLEGILRLQSIKKKEIDQPLRRTLSNDDVAGKLLRKQRLTRKKIASGEISLKRKPSVIWAKVKNMEVTLVVDCDYQRFMQLKIESFEVRRVNTHKDIEELAVDTFIKHLQLLDKDALDLSSQDIKHLQLHSHEVPIGSIFDIASLNIIDHFLPCFLHLKDKHCWSLAAISYDTLIPKSFLEKYVSLIFVHNYVVFYGPSGTGKSYLARRLSHLVAHRIHENSLPIIYSNISLEKWQKIVQEISCDTSDHSKVYVLDGFTQSFLSSNFDISEILTLPQIMKSKSYVICTCTQGLTDSIPSCWQQNFRWIWLPNHEEPVDCLLQRYLRRKYIQYGNFHLQREFFRIVDWLASAWRHINSLIEKFSSSEYTIGPTMFFPCPSDILNAEEWFVDLWNYSICPYFIQTVRNGIKKYGERTNEWIDPLEMILKTYPWSCEKSKLKFIKIRMEDVGYKKNFQLSETSMTETERLMKFLRQLELLMSESNDLFPFQEL